MKPLALFGSRVSIALIALLCTSLIVEAQVWDNEPLHDNFSDFPGTPLQTHSVLVAPEGEFWYKSTLDGSWEIDAAGTSATDTDTLNTDHRVLIDSSVSDGAYIFSMEWNSGLVGFVVRSDGIITPNETLIFGWYDDSVPNFTMASLDNGVFGTLGTITCDQGFAGRELTAQVTANETSLHVLLICPVTGVNQRTFTLTNPDLVDGTHVGLFSRDGAGDNLFNEIEVFSSQVEEPKMPVDFTPFLYIAGMLAGLILLGYGETHRTGQYIMAGALLFVAATIPTGIAWLIVISGIAFIPAMYRGYIHITTANNQGRVE